MFKIFDWMHNEVNTGGKVFDTFEDGWEWIYTNVPNEDNAYDDLFVLQCNEDGVAVELE